MTAAKCPECKQEGRPDLLAATCDDPKSCPMAPAASGLRGLSSTAVPPGTCLTHGPFVGHVCPSCSTAAPLPVGINAHTPLREKLEAVGAIREIIDAAREVLDYESRPRRASLARLREALARLDEIRKGSST